MSRPAAAGLRRGRAGDLEALLTIERAVFTTDILSRRSLLHFLTATNATVLVAEDEGAVAGYALVLYRRNSKLARLYSIAVGAAFRRRGWAQRLLTAAEQKAAARGRRVMRIEVRADNRSAIDLYESAGYRRFGTLARYYGGRIDALRYQKPLRRDRRPAPRRRPPVHKTA